MYLIVFDSNCVKQNREYYLCKGDYLKNVLNFFSEIKDIKEDEIEEILICSLKRITRYPYTQNTTQRRRLRWFNCSSQSTAK